MDHGFYFLGHGRELGAEVDRAASQRGYLDVKPLVRKDKLVFLLVALDFDCAAVCIGKVVLSGGRLFLLKTHVERVVFLAWGCRG